jgi:hypothetical protein
VRLTELMPDESTEPQKPEQSAAEESSSPTPEQDWRRRKRLDAVFGDVLPETTSDERETGDRPTDNEPSGDQWLRAQVPPHHG